MGRAGRVDQGTPYPGLPHESHVGPIYKFQGLWLFWVGLGGTVVVKEMMKMGIMRNGAR
jgi:hypothetical protein